MRKVLLSLVCMLAISCKKPVVDRVVVDICNFGTNVDVENETPLPFYSLALQFSDCEDERIALFREHVIVNDSLPIRLGIDLETITLEFNNSVAITAANDQNFTITVDSSLVGNGFIEDGMAYIQSYSTTGTFYYRLFNEDGWLSPYESSQDGFCTEGTGGLATEVPPIEETLVDNDSGWGNDVELSYVFDPNSGEYEACVSGVPGDYFIEWKVNEEIYFGNGINVRVGKSPGIYFISGAIYYNDERVTLSHIVNKDITSKTGVRRARIRRPSGG